MDSKTLSWLNLLLSVDTVAELRIPVTGKSGMVSGYFDAAHRADMVKAMSTWDGKAHGIYATINPVNPALLARAQNRSVNNAKTTTSDADILKRTRFPIDFDAIRPSGISSTDAEHNAAIEIARTVRQFLTTESWPEPIFADSGNGAHLVYEIDLPNDNINRDLLSTCLKALAFKFQDERVAVDSTTYNAARIWKLYGTMACKGDNIPDRPHRMSAILEAPELLWSVTLDQMKWLASIAPPTEPRPQYQSQQRSQAIDIPDFLSRAGLKLSKTKPGQQGATVYELEQCPWNSEHVRSAYIIQFPSNAIVAKCHHNSCQGKGWRDIWEQYKPVVQPSKNGNSPVIDKLTDMGGGERGKGGTRGEGEITKLKRDNNGTDNGTDGTTTGHGTVSGQVAGQPLKTLSERVEEWVKVTSGWFATEELDRDLGISTPAAKENRKKIMQRLRERGEVQQHPKINKQFRCVDKTLVHLNFKAGAGVNIVNVKWPLGIDKYVSLYPGNIAVIAGAPNAGKTALLLNFIRMNMADYPITYFCSEMGQDELSSRLELFSDVSIDDWCFDPIERSSNFADVIVPDMINIVDFLEMTDDLWSVNEHLTAISHKIGSGLAIVALQKKIGAPMGRGQEFGLEKPKLYLSMDEGLLQIVKGKTWTDKTVNPNKLRVKFNITYGCHFEQEGLWYRPKEKGAK